MKKEEIIATNGRTIVEFHAEIKENRAPEIKKKIKVDGEPFYLLRNGNTQSVSSYNAFWKIGKKPKIKPKRFKDVIDPLMVLSNKKLQR